MTSDPTAHLPHSKQYLPALDGLRALAVSGVIATHVQLRFTGLSGIGVYVFFVLSGYLITTLLLIEARIGGAIQLGRFYARRALRLLPALLLLVAATLVYVAFFSADGRVNSVTLRGLPAVLLYYANWAQAWGPQDALGLFFHCWSLAVEEQFYVLWPLALGWLLRHRWRGDALAGLLAAAFTFVLALRIANFRSLADGELLIGTHLVADQLLAGCLLAVVLHEERHRAAVATAARRLFPLAATFLVALAALGEPYGDDFQRRRALVTVGVTTVAAASAVVIARLVTAPASVAARLLASRPLVYLGRISYGMYLWHILVLYALVEHGSLGSKSALFVATYGLTVAAASVSYAVVERPALRLKRRFAPQVRR